MSSQRVDGFVSANNATALDPQEVRLVVNTLRARRGTLETKRSALVAALDRVRAEQAEIATALAVIARHSDAVDPTMSPAAVSNLLTVPGGGQAMGPGWRPPSVPKMIVEILAGGPLTSRELLKEVRHRFVPGIKADAVGPAAWRMVRHGRLAKIGRKYALLQHPPEAPGPPDP